MVMPKWGTLTTRLFDNTPLYCEEKIIMSPEIGQSLFDDFQTQSFESNLLYEQEMLTLLMGIRLLLFEGIEIR
jgi:hypothetical protein